MRPVNRQEVYDILESLSLNSKNILRIEEYSFSKILQARYIARNQRRNLEYLLSVVNGDIVIICPLLILIENSWNNLLDAFALLQMQSILYHNSSGAQAFTGNLKKKEVHRAITLHPVKNPPHMYRLHNYMRVGIDVISPFLLFPQFAKSCLPSFFRFPGT